jgi:hypothetical protein
MSPGKQLEEWHKWIAPYLTRVVYAIELKRISRREMLLVADVLEQAAQGLRRIVGEQKNEHSE